MASQKQLELWYGQAQTRLEKFSQQLVDLKTKSKDFKGSPADEQKLAKQIIKSEDGVVEAKAAIEKYAGLLGLSSIDADSQETPVAEVQKKAWPKAFFAKLDSWLLGRSFWTHDDWNCLLGELCAAGYTEIVSGEPAKIGEYLESHRK